MLEFKPSSKLYLKYFVGCFALSWVPEKVPTSPLSFWNWVHQVSSAWGLQQEALYLALKAHLNPLEKTFKKPRHWPQSCFQEHTIYTCWEPLRASGCKLGRRTPWQFRMLYRELLDLSNRWSRRSKTNQNGKLLSSVTRRNLITFLLSLIRGTNALWGRGPIFTAWRQKLNFNITSRFQHPLTLPRWGYWHSLKASKTPTALPTRTGQLSTGMGRCAVL